MNIFKDVYFYFEDKDAVNIFQKLSQNITEEENQVLNNSNTLNYDYISLFRKTPLVMIVNHILEYLQTKLASGEKSELLTNLISIFLLAIADPTFLYKEQRLFENKQEFFSKMKLFFQLDKFGTIYINEEQLKEIFADEDISKFLKEMENFELLKKEDDRYILNEDVIIKHVKI